MRRKSTGDMDCSIARALDVVGECWTLLIVRDLGFDGMHRFEQLQRNLGVARNVLTVRLEKLVEQEIVETRLYQQRPDRYEYHLTAKGRDLAQVLYALLAWGDRWTRAGTVPPIRLEHGVCGQPLVPAMACTKCEAVVPISGRAVRRVGSAVPAGPLSASSGGTSVR